MIRGIEHIFNEFYRLYESGGSPRGESTGWASMDPFLTLRPGEWTVVTGIPGHGKSSWMDNVIVQTAQRADWKWLVFSAENRPIVRHAGNLASIYIGRAFNPGARHMSREDWLYAAAFLESRVQFLEPGFNDCSLDFVLTMAESVRGLNALLIDPWNELDHSRPANVSETEHINTSLSKIRRYAIQRSVHVFIVAHPMKLTRQRDPENGAMTYPVPTLYDISGSAHWRNKCDNGVCVFRNVLDPVSATEIHIQKIRFREVGQVGMCKLYYDAVNGRYIDPLAGAKPAFDVEVYRAEMDERIARHEAELMEAEEQIAMREQ